MSNTEMADSFSKDSEAELAKKLRRGDPSAIEEVYNAYFDRLYSLVFNQVGRDQATAEDIVQETFLSAIKSASKFRGQSKLYTWLCSIAHHKTVDFYRRQGREAKHRNQPLDIDGIESAQIPDSEPLAPSLIESEETRQEVEQALFSLPPDYREVLILKYVEEMPASEISQIMGRSPKSVEGLLTRARKALRAMLAKQDKG